MCARRKARVDGTANEQSTHGPRCVNRARTGPWGGLAGKVRRRGGLVKRPFGRIALGATSAQGEVWAYDFGLTVILIAFEWLFLQT